jgi:uncharacterized protein YceK
MVKPAALLLCVILAGCTSITTEQHVALKSASNLYASATREMSRDELVALLGAPQKTEGQRLTWETAITSKNAEALVVEFRPDGSIARMTQSSERFARGPFWQGGRLIETSK